MCGYIPEVPQFSRCFGTQVLDTDQPTQVTICFFKEVSVCCQGALSFNRTSLFMYNFMFCVRACVCVWGGGGGNSTSGSDWESAAPSFTDRSFKVLTEHSSIPHSPFPRSQSS